METRICKTCNMEISIDKFKIGRLSCIECVKIAKSEVNKKWYEKNRSAIIQKNLNYQKNNRQNCNRRNREYYERLKTECYNILGNACSCGEIDQDVLQIDHINGGGNQEHNTLAQHQLFIKIKTSPDEYQILCANCNWRKRESWLQRSKLTTDLRVSAIVKYGGRCVDCGIDDFEILQFDHIDNDGANNFNHRVMKKRYSSYIREDNNVQLLCCNCHQRKSLKSLKSLKV